MHQHHHFLHFLHNRKLNELYFSIALKSFALSMIGIFVPIYLLQLDYSLAQVFIFFSILAGVHAVGAFPAAKIASRYGFKHSIMFSIPLVILALFMLHTIESFNWPVYLIAVLFGVQNTLFWIGYHVDFAKFSDRKHRGSELGVAKIFTFVFHAIGPLLGGVVLVLFGFQTLFVIAIFIFLGSVVPLLHSKDLHSPITFSLRRIFHRRKIGDVLSFLGFGFERAMSGAVWPIFIFFTILGEQYTSLGFVSSLSVAFSIVATFVIGKFSDINRRLVLRIGAVVMSAVWFVKSLVKNALHVFLIDSAYGVSQSLVQIPFDAMSYDKANKSEIVQFIVFREFTINIGRAFLFFIMIFIADLTAGFLFGGSLGSLLHLFF